MQRLDVMHPNKCDLIVGPLPLHDNIELVIAGTLERPYMTGRHVLDDFKRVSTMNFGRRHSSHGNSPHTGSRHTEPPLPCSPAMTIRQVLSHSGVYHCEIIFFLRLPESRFSSRTSSVVPYGQRMHYASAAMQLRVIDTVTCGALLMNHSARRENIKLL